MRQKCLLLTGCIVLASAISASAHFDILIGDKPWVDRGEAMTLKYYHGHPFEVELGNRQPPVSVVAVHENGDVEDLNDSVEKKSISDHPCYVFTYTPKRSGDTVIAIESDRHFWEDRDACVDFFTKLVVHCRRSVGWDQEIGHPVEIIPYTRPYGMRECSVFCGQVKVNGEPAEGIEVEFERLNETPPTSIPDEPLITGIVKTDKDGNFQLTLDQEGWWGIGTHAETGTIEHDGKTYDREVRAFFWVYVHPRH